MADITAGLIADARNYASTQLTNATAEMNAAMNILEQLGATTGGPVFPGLVVDIPLPDDPGSVPAYTGGHFTPDEYAGEPVPALQVPGVFVAPNDPTPQEADLVFNDPIAPSGEPDASLLQGVPTITTDFTFPVMPDLEGEIAGIVAPALIAIDIPDAPTVVLPEFLGVRPSFNTAMPTDLDQQMRDQYNTMAPIFIETLEDEMNEFLNTNFPGFASGMAAIETRLATYLAGGSALTPAVEDAMYSRTLDKTNAEGRKAAQTALGAAARAGFTIMGPTLTSQLQDVDQDRRRANAQAATEIYVKQAELEQSNLQFAVTKSTELRKIAIDSSISYHTSLVTINGQVVQFARDTVDFVVKAFEVATRYAEVQARLYEAEATIYRAKLDGALAVVRIYEAQIRAEEAKVNVNRSLVEAYKARLEAVLAEANVFRAAVDAVVAEAGLERIKVELYHAQVEAYAAQVNAYTARWQGYSAAVHGQEARMSVNVEHAKAFEARANAYTALVRGRVAAIESVTSTNKGLVDVYRAEVDAYGALERAKADAARIDVEQYDATIKAYMASTDAISQKSRAVIARAEVILRGLIETAHIDMEELREQHHIQIVKITSMANVATAAGHIFAGVAQSAMSGMNTLAADVTNATA